MNARRSQHGFSLLELMIVVVIIGILVSIALPSYESYVRRSNRASAQTFLMQVANREQQYFADARVYADTVAGLGLSVPAEVSKFYTVTIAASTTTPPTFTVTATATGSQLADGDLTINSAGQKTLAGQSGKW